MTIEMTAEELRIEREQVEWVFGLELSDRPLTLNYRGEHDGPSEPLREMVRRYHYDGAPEYATDLRIDCAGEDEREHFTVVSDCLFGLMPEHVTDAHGVTWERVAFFRSSGERECPCRELAHDDGHDEETHPTLPCKLCGEDEEHGFIYLGDGWGETVYQRTIHRCECGEEMPRIGPQICKACVRGWREDIDRGTDTALAAYVECALWSSNDESTDAGGEPFDKNYSAEDIAASSLASMRADVERFVCLSWEDTYFALDRAGRDFWLTRNGHGCGFWDGSYWGDEDGARLTELAKGFGTSDLYLGDDGKIYVSPEK